VGSAYRWACAAFCPRGAGASGASHDGAGASPHHPGRCGRRCGDRTPLGSGAGAPRWAAGVAEGVPYP